MKKLLLVLVALGLGLGAVRVVAQRATVRALPSFGEPGLSPDGNSIAFVTGGDIWEVPAAGGDARILVSHPALESRPLFAPDGKHIAFTSTRTGGGDVYVLSLDTNDLTRLTFDDANDLVTGWSPDSQYVYFSTGSHELANMSDVYRVAAGGGTPQPVAADRYTMEYFASPATDGTTVAITARGMAGGQWWRLGHSHLDESEIWLVRTTSGAPKYDPITNGGAKDAWPMWGGNDRTLYFMSDRSGAQNIWTQTIGGAAKAVTKFDNGRVLWPTISKNGQTIAFERNFGIWTVNTGSGNAREVPIVLRGASAATAPEHRTFTDQIQELSLSPDGKKLAFTVHGEIFSASAKDGGDALRITHSAGNENELVWSPDSRRLTYVSDRDGSNHLYAYNFSTNLETSLTSGPGRDDVPVYSPDGKWIAFERDSRELRVIDPATKQERLLVTAIFDTPPFGTNGGELVWSPDSKFIAYTNFSAGGFATIGVVPADGSAPARQVSFISNTYGGPIRWSPDGTYLTYTTAQRTEPGQVVRIDLLPRTPLFQEDQFRDLFKEELPRRTPEPTPTPAPPAEPPKDATTPAAATTTATPPPAAPGKKPVEIVFDGIRTRLSVVRTGLDVGDHAISPDGKWLLFSASAAGQQNLYVYSLDELAKEPAVARQLTSTPGAKRNAQFTPDSKEVLYLDRGRIFNVTLERREPRPVAVTAELDVDFSQEKLEAFRQAWTYLRDRFFDEKMNGVDWNAVKAAYEPRIAGVRTPDEMRRVISLMLGELNASHMGISGPGGGGSSTGRLALDFDRAEYETTGRLRVTDVVAPFGQAGIAGVKVGDYLTAIDGVTITRQTNIDELLQYKINRRVVLGVAAAANGPTREVVVKPVDQTNEKFVRYKQWVEGRRAYVAKASGGRLGYVHMIDMSQDSLNQLYLDLDAENRSRDGVVIDMRNNTGGFVNVYAIDVLARRGYMQMLQRGFESMSSRTYLGQRSLERPTILVTNQHSLSDAEDFTEGYRALKLGKVVGERTAGWIIFTSSATLVDGSTLRVPQSKALASDGTPMEMHPRAVDIPVKRAMGESYSARDAQLDTAVAELLKDLGPSRPKPTSGN